MKKPILFNDKILVRQNNIKSEVIFVPSGARTLERAEGKVVAVADNLSIDIQVGDYIVYGRYAGHKVPGYKDLYTILAADILWKEGEEVDKIEGFEEEKDNGR